MCLSVSKATIVANQSTKSIMTRHLLDEIQSLNQTKKHGCNVDLLNIGVFTHSEVTNFIQSFTNVLQEF